MSLSYTLCFVSSLDLNLRPTVYWINYLFFSWMKRAQAAGFIAVYNSPTPLTMWGRATQNQNNHKHRQHLPLKRLISGIWNKRVREVITASRVWFITGSFWRPTKYLCHISVNKTSFIRISSHNSEEMNYIHMLEYTYPGTGIILYLRELMFFHTVAFFRRYKRGEKIPEGRIMTKWHYVTRTVQYQSNNFCFFLQSHFSFECTTVFSGYFNVCEYLKKDIFPWNKSKANLDASRSNVLFMKTSHLSLV